ncbi:MAG: hypothetical protein ACYCZN_12080 [Candidatus Dormibacteria bacterium]
MSRQRPDGWTGGGGGWLDSAEIRFFLACVAWNVMWAVVWVLLAAAGADPRVGVWQSWQRSWLWAWLTITGHPERTNFMQIFWWPARPGSPVGLVLLAIVVIASAVLLARVHSRRAEIAAAWSRGSRARAGGSSPRKGTAMAKSAKPEPHEMEKDLDRWLADVAAGDDE